MKKKDNCCENSECEQDVSVSIKPSTIKKAELKRSLVYSWKGDVYQSLQHSKYSESEAKV